MARRAISMLLMLLSVAQVSAQDEPSGPPQGDERAGPSSVETIWHVVRPGDTIEGLTALLLGTAERWEENWKMNPDVEDPHRIFPGKRLRLLLPPKLPENRALLIRLSRQVEHLPTPLPWEKAEQNELLRFHDGLKTFEGSSAELRFPDDTLLLVTEQSLIFLGREKQQPVPLDRRQIEIVVGQADLEGTSVASGFDLIEIVLGEATATPRPDERGVLKTRARKPQGGGAQLMVYSGESEFAAAGVELTVPSGMGSSVAVGEPPSPPEKLLPAPATVGPAAESRLATPRPAFSWEPVAGARTYTLEVCRDPRCGALLERAVELTGAKWRPAGLPAAELFWRVTAVSASGLDGYPSEAVPFTILTVAEDTEPPVVHISVLGPRVIAPRSGLHTQWLVGPGMEFEIEVEDAVSGVRQWTPHIDGEPSTLEALKGPWTRGEHALVIVAADRAGNRRETEPMAFIYDPDPPALSWGVEGFPAIGHSGSDAPEGDKGPLGRGLRGRRMLRADKRDWQLDSDLAQVVARPQTRKPLHLEGIDKAVGPQHGFWVLAEDAVCPDLLDLTYELVAGSKREATVLRVEAVDCLGNTSRGEWPLVRDRSRKYQAPDKSEE